MTDINERMAELQYEAGMYQSLYENAVKQRDEFTRALDALVSAEALAGVRGLVAGWNGEGRENGPFPRHPANIGATLKTRCKAVYDLDEALQEARRVLGAVSRSGESK